MDEHRRKLERQVAQGDQGAEDKLDRAYQRLGDISPVRREAYTKLLQLLRLLPPCPECGKPNGSACKPYYGSQGHICYRCGFVSIAYPDANQNRRIYPVASLWRGLPSMRGIGIIDLTKGPE